MLDYVLTAAVSVTAGVAEIASAFPLLWPYRVWLALALLGLITLLNLRGLREIGHGSWPCRSTCFCSPSSRWSSLGSARSCSWGCRPSRSRRSLRRPSSPLTLFLVMHAFSAGCTALTGIEAISNGVPAFKPPSATNARTTLGVMAGLMAVIFLGSMGLTQYLGVVARADETILSALSRTLLGEGMAYYLVQFSTLGILAVAANTSFAGFPRLAAILSNDKFMPRQINHLGDRLVFTNGIGLLVGLAAFLIVIFNGDSHLLVPLFAVGAFSAFTLSQAGMVVHWYRDRTAGLQIKSMINGLGALVTGFTLIVISISKFREGAWISIIIIPLIVVFVSAHPRALPGCIRPAEPARAAAFAAPHAFTARGATGFRRPPRDDRRGELRPLPDR